MGKKSWQAMKKGNKKILENPGAGVKFYCSLSYLLFIGSLAITYLSLSQCPHLSDDCNILITSKCYENIEEYIGQYSV